MGALSLKVLLESVLSASAEQVTTLNVAQGATVWCREVLTSVQGQGAVFVRSLTPWLPEGPAWPELTDLGQRALREILYGRDDISRTDFVYCSTAPDRISLAHRDAPGDQTMMGRRSCFLRHGDPLLVSEYFLPAFWHCIEMVGAA